MQGLIALALLFGVVGLQIYRSGGTDRNANSLRILVRCLTPFSHLPKWPFLFGFTLRAPVPCCITSERSIPVAVLGFVSPAAGKIDD